MYGWKVLLLEVPGQVAWVDWTISCENCRVLEGMVLAVQGHEPASASGVNGLRPVADQILLLLRMCSKESPSSNAGDWQDSTT